MNAVTASLAASEASGLCGYHRSVYVALMARAAHLDATRRTEVRHSLAASCCDHPRTNRR